MAESLEPCGCYTCLFEGGSHLPKPYHDDHDRNCRCFWCQLPQHPAVYAVACVLRDRPRRLLSDDEQPGALIADVEDLLRCWYRQDHAVSRNDQSGWDAAWAWEQLFFARHSNKVCRHPDWSDYVVLSPPVAGDLGVLVSWGKLHQALARLRFDAPEVPFPPDDNDPAVAPIAARLGWSASDVDRVANYKGQLFARVLNELDVFEQFVEDSKTKVVSPRLREMLATEGK